MTGIQKNIMISLLLIVWNGFATFAQQPTENEIDDLLDELILENQDEFSREMEDLNRFDLIYTSMNYNSNTYFSGRDSGVNQFNFTPQISYFNSSGFNAGIGGAYYQKLDPEWDFTILSAGYSKAFGKNDLLRANVGVSKYIYTDGNSSLSNDISSGLSIRNKKRTLGAKLSATYLTGDGEQAFQFVPSIYSNTTLKKVSNKYSVQFSPRLSLVFANQTVATEQLVTRMFKRRNRPVRQVTATTIIEKETFSPLNTRLNLPINFATNSWDFELGYNLNLPIANETESNLNPTSFGNISVGYLFDLKKNKK